jgi:hypothetical protein
MDEQTHRIIGNAPQLFRACGVHAIPMTDNDCHIFRDFLALIEVWPIPIARDALDVAHEILQARLEKLFCGTDLDAMLRLESERK